MEQAIIMSGDLFGLVERLYTDDNLFIIVTVISLFNPQYLESS